MEIETQDQLPKIPLSLEEVGITDFKTQISITRGTRIYRYIADVSVVINLPSNRKGAHMSRFVETISEILSTEVNTHYSLEKMSIHVLKTLYELHPFQKGAIDLKFIFFARRHTPVSKRKTIENYDVKLITLWDQGNIKHELTMGTYGNTVCPHALSKNLKGHTHIQRSYAELTLKGKTEDIPDMEDISKILDECFSAPTYSLLKSEDEQWIVNQMWNNPLFVEDVSRNLLELASKHFLGSDLEITAKSISYESIHKHNIVSKGSTKIMKV